MLIACYIYTAYYYQRAPAEHGNAMHYAMDIVLCTQVRRATCASYLFQLPYFQSLRYCTFRSYVHMAYFQSLLSALRDLLIHLNLSTLFF